jgi:hypothetical protein
MNCNKMTITEIIESRKTWTEWLVPNPTVFPEKGVSYHPQELSYNIYKRCLLSPLDLTRKVNEMD